MNATLKAGTPAARWETLRVTLREDGLGDSRVIERPYSESVRGRVRHGVSRSIVLRVEGAGLIEISDRYNDTVWLGWRVDADDLDSINVWHTGPTKKRADVVAGVRTALKELSR